MSYLVLDIESAPWMADEYAAIWPKSKKRAGLHAIISQVVCVGLRESGQTSMIAPPEFTSEKKVLEWVQVVLREHKNSDIVGYNTKNFDFPFLQIRAAKYGIKLDLPDKRALRNKDIFEAMGGKWATDVSSCSLSELAFLLYAEGKKTDGGDVARWWSEKNYEAIKRHCAEDVELTDRVYNDLKGVFF
jgi:DNA polymerase elongation subunit (family B)